MVAAAVVEPNAVISSFLIGPSGMSNARLHWSNSTQCECNRNSWSSALNGSSNQKILLYSGELLKSLTITNCVPFNSRRSRKCKHGQSKRSE